MKQNWRLKKNEFSQQCYTIDVAVLRITICNFDEIESEF